MGCSASVGSHIKVIKQVDAQQFHGVLHEDTIETAQPSSSEGVLNVWKEYEAPQIPCMSPDVEKEIIKVQDVQSPDAQSLSKQTTSTCDTLDGDHQNGRVSKNDKSSTSPHTANGKPTKRASISEPTSSFEREESRKGSKEGKERFSLYAKKAKTLLDFTQLVNLQIVQTVLERGDNLTGKDVLDFLQESGLHLDDPRSKYIVSQCRGWQLITEAKATILFGNNLVKKALRLDLVIDDFKGFTQTFSEIYHQASQNVGGRVASYIPQLARVNPDFWGAAVCTVDGQRFGIGHVDIPFCVQSTSKPITYAIALELHGESKVHQYVGREPSGRNFNDRCLMARPGQASVPHNPYINAGAIMAASLVKMDTNEWDRFDYMIGIWQKLSAGTKPSFQNNTFMGERATASRNFCLAYMMEEEQVFPTGTDLHKTLEAYFAWCSIEITTRSMSIVAATLANGGICPTTTERIFTHQTVTNTLSLMMSCGMYDYSGRFAFDVGFPAKSGVSGVVCIVIPGVCGIATFSPRLDSLGNSVRGIDFCTRLSQRFPYHVFSQEPQTSKADRIKEKRDRKSGKGGAASEETPKNQNRKSQIRRQRTEDMILKLDAEDEKEGLRLSLLWSAARGDEQRIRQLAVRGVDLNSSDWDKRTALHLAASEGHESCVRLLVELNADMHAKDHQGNTPMDDAIRIGAKWTWTLEPETPADNSTKGRRNLFRYFVGDADAITSQCRESVPQKLLSSALESYGISTRTDPRMAFLASMPDPFTSDEMEYAAMSEPVIAKALTGHLVVPNFGPFAGKFQELFSKMTTQVSVDGGTQGATSNLEALNVMTVDGQRLHLGSPEQYLCAGDLVSVALFAVSVELLGLDSVVEFVSLEPSGSKSSADILNSENLPYNPFMWNGILALCALLEEKIGDAGAVIAEYWTKLCGLNYHSSLIEYDEAYEKEDKRKHFHPVSSLVHKALGLQKFPAKPSPDLVVNTFFRMRAIRTSTKDLGSIGAVFANSGKHPLTNMVLFKPDTVKAVQAMMYSAGCEAQSGDVSFKVGVPAKSSGEGAILIVWPNVMGVCVVCPQVQDNGVSLGGLNFCIDFGNEFNCHVLSGNSTSSAKLDPCLYHFQTDMKLCSDLIYAAERGDMMMLSKLHHLGFDLEYPSYDNRTAVHLAAENGQVRVLKYLFKKGVDLKAKDRWGHSPLDAAYAKCQSRAALLLKTLVGEDDDDPMSRLTNAVSCIGSSGRLWMRRQSHDSCHEDKAIRKECPVAAKMEMEGSSSSECMQENCDEDDKIVVTDDQAAKMIQRRFRKLSRAIRKQTVCWQPTISREEIT